VPGNKSGSIAASRSASTSPLLKRLTSEIEIKLNLKGSTVAIKAEELGEEPYSYSPPLRTHVCRNSRRRTLLSPVSTTASRLHHVDYLQIRICLGETYLYEHDSSSSNMK
jgi:hypothetical protein